MLGSGRVKIVQEVLGVVMRVQSVFLDNVFSINNGVGNNGRGVKLVEEKFVYYFLVFGINRGP